MIFKDVSLRTNHYTCTVGAANSNDLYQVRPAHVAIPQGAPQLPNGSLQRAHIWVSYSIQKPLQYAPDALIQWFQVWPMPWINRM
jgi:hypothetical protein